MITLGKKTAGPVHRPVEDEYVIREIDHKPFSKRIDRTIIEGVVLPERPHETQSKAWRASGLASCIRSQAYKVVGAPETHVGYNADYERASGQGTWLHENIQKHMVAADDMLYVHPEYGPAVELRLTDCCDTALTAFRKKLQFTGHIDGVLKTLDGGLAIFDLKTVALKDLEPDNEWFSNKLHKYAVQVNAYAHFFMAHDGRKAKQAFVLCMARDDTSVRRMFHIPYQPEKIAEELKRVTSAQAMIASGRLPLAEPGACRFCAHRGLCDSNNYKG